MEFKTWNGIEWDRGGIYVVSVTNAPGAWDGTVTGKNLLP